MQPRHMILTAHIFAALLATTSLAAQAEEISLVAKLVRMPENPPACGWAKVSSLTEYEVIKIRRGNYKKQRIYVVHTCIELPRLGRKFMAGDLHKLELSTKDTEDRKFIFRADMLPKDHELYYCNQVERIRRWQLWLHN